MFFFTLECYSMQCSTFKFTTVYCSVAHHSEVIGVQCSLVQLRTVQCSEGNTMHYIILNIGILKSNSLIFLWSEGCTTQYTPSGVYGLIVNDNNEVNISLMSVRKI